MAETDVAEVSIVERAVQPAFEVSAKPNFWRIPTALASGYSEIGKHIEATGATRSGMPYARYLELDWQSLRNSGFKQFLDFLWKKQRMQIGIPIEQNVTGNDRVSGTEIAAGKYIMTIHLGHYHKVGEAYRRIIDWAAQQNLRPSNESIEWYIDDPSGKPMDEVRTQVFVPLLD